MYPGTEQRAAQAYEHLPKNTAGRSEVDHRGERIICPQSTDSLKKDTTMIFASAFRYLNGHKTKVMHDPVPLRAT